MLSPLRVFLFFFISTLAISFGLQLVILPYFIPSLHAGYGLMVGHDSVNIHALIIKLLPKIDALGISALIPFASMDYFYHIVGFLYLHVTPKPYVMLPLNCLSISLGALFLYLLLIKYTKYRQHAFWAASLLLFLPSSLGLYTQLQRDCFVIAGILGVLWSWNALLAPPPTPIRFYYFSTLLTSLYCTHLFRGYLIPILLIGLTVTFALQIFFNWKKEKLASLSLTASFLIGVAFWATSLEQPEIRVSLDNHEQMDKEISKKNDYSPTLDWHRTVGLPNSIEEKAMSLERVRKGFLFESKFGSFNVDEAVEFHRFFDIIKYFPRSVQLAVFSPFPNHWFQKAKSKTGSLFRNIMVGEMVCLYLCQLATFFFLWQTKDRTLFLTLLFTLIPVVFYPLVVVNLGTLYRLRFPWIILFYAFGALTGLRLLEGKSTRQSFRRFFAILPGTSDNNPSRG